MNESRVGLSNINHLQEFSLSDYTYIDCCLCFAIGMSIELKWSIKLQETPAKTLYESLPPTLRLVSAGATTDFSDLTYLLRKVILTEKVTH